MCHANMNEIDATNEVSCICSWSLARCARLVWNVGLLALHVDTAGFRAILHHSACFTLYADGNITAFLICHLYGLRFNGVEINVYLHSNHLSNQKNRSPPTRLARAADFQSIVECLPLAIMTASIGVDSCHLSRYTAYCPISRYTASLHITTPQSHVVRPLHLHRDQSSIRRGN